MRSLALAVLVALGVAPAAAQGVPPSARALLERAAEIGQIADAAERTSAANALWSALRAAGRVPFAVADSAVFLWRGSAASVAVAGDHTGWQPSAALARQGASDLWLRLDTFDPAARVDYKLVLNGSNWVIDPNNPHQQMSGFGPNSELRMPAWQAEPLAVRNPAVAAGATGPQQRFESALYTTAPVAYRVWTPAGYDPAADRLHPLLVVTDGHEYADDRLGALPIVLDNLVAQGRIEPPVVVFLDPRWNGTNRRQEQFVGNAAFAAFVATELVPAVEAAFRVRADRDSRVIYGTSLGGLFSTYLGVRHPDVFGRLAIQSPAYWIREAIFDDVAASAPGAFRVSMTWGSIRDGGENAARMRDAMQVRGHDVAWRTVPEGHSWGQWRALHDEALEHLLPPAPVSADPEPGSETGLRLDAVPNPSAGAVALRFTLSAPADVRLACLDAAGRTVAVAAEGPFGAGAHDVRLDTARLAAGVYLCRLDAAGRTAVRALTVAG